MKNQIITSLALSAIAFSLFSCAQTPAPTTDNPAPQTSKASDTIPTVKVTVFRADSQCLELIGEEVSVPTTNTMEAAVGKAIEYVDGTDINIGGYRLQADPQNQIVTVDLRVAADSQRQLASLSTCEQFALFGGLEKTLTSNPDWQVRKVKFTERGEEIFF